MPKKLSGLFNNLNSEFSENMSGISSKFVDVTNLGKGETAFSEKKSGSL